MADDSQENALRRLGGAMKKLKGLVCLGIGLFMLVLWAALFIYLSYELYVPPRKPFVILLMHSLYVAFAGILSRPIPGGLWPITGFAFIFIGLYRLVCSLFEEEEEED